MELAQPFGSELYKETILAVLLLQFRALLLDKDKCRTTNYEIHSKASKQAHNFFSEELYEFHRILR